ncbi:N-formylglutamate amidohydrolase [Bordetella sputigena]|uniref:N-formylglutamate deformylase n=1 Tax=Bordetella sputigena TaxID=1416810 RepID=UPI0039F11B0E
MTDLPYHFKAGTTPLLISIPHLGREIPDAQLSRMTPRALQRPDTDWHLDLLYDFGEELGASILHARYSRYVVDLNRPPDDAHLYPGQEKTGLFPELTFHGEPLYLDNAVLSAQERERRLNDYWHPYHAKLALEIDRIRARHSVVLLWEAHSIASVLPRLFDGKLPDLNIGTAQGRSCGANVIGAVEGVLQNCRYTWAVDGRFKGGHITRTFGDPDHGVHAVQLEMCQSTYMSECYPYEYRKGLASEIKPVIRAMIVAALEALRSPDRQ